VEKNVTKSVKAGTIAKRFKPAVNLFQLICILSHNRENQEIFISFCEALPGPSYRITFRRLALTSG
jgi:hypothetical protein